MVSHTNSRDEFERIVAKKLNESAHGVVLIYTMISPFLEGSYSIQLIKGDLPSIFVKQFKGNLNESYGLFKTDEIKIASHVVEISRNTFNKLIQIEDVEFFNKEHNSSVIDGRQCSLNTFIENPKSFKWVSFDELNPSAAELINDLCHCAFR